MIDTNERLYSLALNNARHEWGEPAWQKLGSRIRRALIAEELLQIAAAQDDEHVSAERVRAIVQIGFRMLIEREV